MSKMDKLARELNALKRQVAGMNTPQLAYSAIEDGAINEYDIHGNLVARIGKQPDGSHGTVIYDGPTPLVPSTPGVDAKALSIAVGWDGYFLDPDTGDVDLTRPAYADFAYIEIHVGDEPFFTPTKDTLSGFINSAEGGTVGVPAPAGTRYVRLVTRSLAGKTSEPSQANVAEVETLVDPGQFEDLEQLLNEASEWIAQTGVELDQRLHDAEGDLADARAELADAKSRLDTLRDETLPALRDRIADAETRLDDIPGLLDALQTALDEAKDTLDDLNNTDLPALRARLDGAEDALSDLQDTTIPALRGDVDSAQGRLDEAFGEGASWNLGDALDDLEGRAAADAAAKAQAAQNAATAAGEAAAAAEAEAARTAAIAEATGNAEDLAAAAEAAAKAAAAVDAKAKADAAQAAAEAKAAAAQAAAEAAQEAADLTPRPHTSTSAPTPSDVMPVNTRWEQVDSAGRVIGIWTQTQAPEGGSWAARALDLSLVRASSAVIDDALIQRLSVAIATVIELNADRITSGQIDAEHIDVTDLAAAMATVLELDAGVIRTGQLGADRINVNDLSAAIASIIELNADRITSGKITSARIDVADLAAEIATIIELHADRITAGKLGADQIDVAELAAEAALIINARLENLVVTAGATINEAVINKLWTDVVRSRKITTDMLLVGSGDNYIPNGALVGDISGTNFWTNGTGFTVETETNGQKAYRFTSNGSRRTARFPVMPGKYRFTVEARAGVTATRFYVQFIHSGTASNPYPISNRVISQAATQWATYTGEIEVTESGWGPDTEMVLYYNHTNGTQGSWQEFRNFRLTSMTDASLIVDGTIAARHVDALSIAGEVGEFIELTADQITGGTINAALDMSAQGSLTVGSTASRHVYVANGAVASRMPGQTGPVTEVQMGGAETAFRVLGPSGEHIAGIEPDGSMITPELDAGAVRVGGTDLTEMLAPMSGGVVVWAPSAVTGSHGPYGATRTGMWDFDFEAVGGRRYRIDVSGRAIASGTRRDVVIGLIKTQTEDGTIPPAPVVTGERFYERAVPTPNGTTGFTETFWFMPSRNEHSRFLLYGTAFTGNTWEVSELQIVVTDLGTNPDNTGRRSLGGASGTTPDPTPPTKEYVKTWNFDTHQVWTQYGKGDTYAPQWVRHGTTSGVNSIYRTYLPLPSGALSALSSAVSVSKIEIRLAQTSGYSGKPWLGTITTSNVSGTTEPTIYNAFQSGTSFQIGQNRWITLPTAARNHLAGAGRGIVVGRRTSVTLLDFYGTSAGSSVRPQVRIHYTA